MRGFRGIVVLALMISLSATATHAANTEYSLGASLVYNENINLLFNPVDSELSQTLIGSVVIAEDDADLKLDLDAQLQLINYKNEQVDDRNIGRFFADVLWRIDPRHFEWYLSDRFTQTSINPNAADSPSNEQNANIFVTGPNYIIRFNSRSNLVLESRITNSLFENGIDNNRLGFAARWFYDINTRLKMGFNTELETVEYDSNANTLDNDRGDVFLSFAYINGLTAVEAELGSSTIDYKSGRKIDETRSLLTVTSQRTRTSNIEIQYSRNLTDTTNQLSSIDSESLIDNNLLITTSIDTFLSERLTFAYNKETSFGRYRLATFSEDRTYTIDESLDRELKSLRLFTQFNLSGSNELSIQANYLNTFYKDPLLDREDDDYIYQINYSHLISRNYSFRINLESLQRESTAASENYEDKQVLFSFEYTSL